MENILRITEASEVTDVENVLGIYYTSIPLEGTTEAMARITFKDSDLIVETTHAVAKQIDLAAFPLDTRKPVAPEAPVE